MINLFFHFYVLRIRTGARKAHKYLWFFTHRHWNQWPVPILACKSLPGFGMSFFKAIKDLHSHTINPSFDLNKQHLQFPTRKFFFILFNFKDYTGPTDWGCNWQKSSSALGCHGDDKIRQMSRPSGPGPPTAADEGTPGPMGYHDTQHLEHGGQKFHAICCK